MSANIKISFLIFILAAFIGCGPDIEQETNSVLGEVIHPMDNPYSDEKVELGRKLFFDKRLSLDNEISCATCHDPEKAFTDGEVLGKGVKGRKAMRNSPTLFNVGYSKVFMFDGEIDNLEEQALVPILDHNEMGASMKEVLTKLNKDKGYRDAARKLYNREFDAWVLTRSLACYERTLISDNSDFDKFYFENNEKAISASAKRGWKLFSGRLNCVKCHPAPFFTDYQVHNNGRTFLETEDKGRFRINNDSTEIGFFKVPTLRNISITAPYMHDGSIETLDLVIDYYAKGGGKGVNQEGGIVPFELSKEEKKDLINFLKSLNDND